MNADSRDWEGLLDPDEKILWQGAPNAGWSAKDFKITQFLFLIPWTGFSVFWMVKASEAPGPFWMFGLFFFFTGIGGFFDSIFGAQRRRKGSFYTLTSKRGFIASKGYFKKSLKSYPILADATLEYDGEIPGSVYFAEESYKDSDGDRQTQKIGFERIENAREVYRLMRDVQLAKQKGTDE